MAARMARCAQDLVAAVGRMGGVDGAAVGRMGGVDGAAAATPARVARGAQALVAAVGRVWTLLRPQRLRTWLAALRTWSLRLGACGLGCGRNACARGSLRSGLGRCAWSRVDAAAAATHARVACGAQALVAAVGRVWTLLRPQRLRVWLAALRTWSLRLGACGLGCGRNACACGSLHSGLGRCGWARVDSAAAATPARVARCTQDVVAAVGRTWNLLRPQRLRAWLAALRTWSLRLGACGLCCGRNACACGSRHPGLGRCGWARVDAAAAATPARVARGAQALVAAVGRVWTRLRPQRLRTWLAALRTWSLRLGARGLCCSRNACAYGLLRSGLGRCGWARVDAAAAATPARVARGAHALVAAVGRMWTRLRPQRLRAWLAALRTWSLRLGACGLGCSRNACARGSLRSEFGRCGWARVDSAAAATPARVARCAQDVVAAVGRVWTRLRPQRLRAWLAALRTWSLRLGACGLGCGRNACACGSLRLGLGRCGWARVDSAAAATPAHVARCAQDLVAAVGRTWTLLRPQRLHVWLAALRAWSLRLGACGLGCGRNACAAGRCGWARVDSAAAATPARLRPQRLRAWLAALRTWSLQLGARGLCCGRNACTYGSLRSGLGRCGWARVDSAAAATPARLRPQRLRMWLAALRTWSLRLGACGLGCGRNACACGSLRSGLGRCGWARMARCAQDLVAAVRRMWTRLRPQHPRVWLAALRTWSLRLGACGLGCGRNDCARGSLRTPWSISDLGRRARLGRRTRLGRARTLVELGPRSVRTPWSSSDLGRCAHLGGVRTTVGAHPLVEHGPWSVRTPVGALALVKLGPWSVRTPWSSSDHGRCARLDRARTLVGARALVELGPWSVRVPWSVRTPWSSSGEWWVRTVELGPGSVRVPWSVHTPWLSSGVWSVRTP